MTASTVSRPTARRPRKSLGQHFLTDPRIANRIVAAAEPTAGDTVVEIGPGTGALTRRLVAQAGRVVGLELDQGLAAELPGRLDYPDNLTVHRCDARHVTIADLPGVAAEYKVVANLPYYAAAPIVRRLLESECPPSLLVVMVQREVAEAMTAKPGAMTLMSVATQFYAETSVVVQAPARAFRPPPKVSSTVVKLAVRAAPATTVADRERFFALVRAGFAAPRKQLRNSLMQGTGADGAIVSGALIEAGIDGQRRAATLKIGEWGALDAAWPDGAPRERTGSRRPSTGSG